MLFTNKELFIAINSIDTMGQNEEGNWIPRYFENSKLADVASASKKITSLADEAGVIADGEYDIAFTTPEKSLILACLKRKWARLDAEFVISLEKKLNE